MHPRDKGTREFHQPEHFIQPLRRAEPQISFTDKENEINLRRCKKQKFYDQSICRHLCSRSLILESTRKTAISPCEKICFELTKSFAFAGLICPFEKYCIKGCPCEHYRCKKIEFQQEKVPVWDLSKRKTIAVPDIEEKDIGLITKRNKDYASLTGENRKRHFIQSPIKLVDLTKKDTLTLKVSEERLFSHEIV